MSSEPDTPAPIDWGAQIARTLHVNNNGDSHTERGDAVTFHPSQLSRCKRQATISKYGLEEHDTKTLGAFHVGTLLHEWLEGELAGRLPGVEHEIPVTNSYADPDGGGGIIEITGHADVYDEHAGVVYDFKTRGGWYKFDPPSERHINQLTLYMDALGADAGQIVYINKKDMGVRTWPDGETFAFDPPIRDGLLSKAREIRDAVTDMDVMAVSDVPFDPCGCWLCNMEEDDE